MGLVRGGQGDGRQKTVLALLTHVWQPSRLTCFIAA